MRAEDHTEAYIEDKVRPDVRAHVEHYHEDYPTLRTTLRAELARRPFTRLHQVRTTSIPTMPLLLPRRALCMRLEGALCMRLEVSEVAVHVVAWREHQEQHGSRHRAFEHYISSRARI